jgi:uncharacterized protein YejL (UPF0352 family)
LKLFRLAAIATIIGTAILIWEFIERPGAAKNSLDGTAVQGMLNKEKGAVDLSLDLPVYKGERKWLLEMHRAALAMSYADAKRDALRNVVKASINSGDLNMAIIAAKDSPYSDAQADILEEIVNVAIQNRESVGYAVVAADNIPYADRKDAALKKVVAASEQFSKQEPNTARQP